MTLPPDQQEAWSGRPAPSPPGPRPQALAWLAVLAVTTTNLMGNGFYVPVQDPFAAARGNAFVATADRASAVYYNPAGLTQLDEIELHAGLYAINLGLDANVMGVDVETDDQLSVVPQLYLALPLSDKLAAGFGVNTPFGLSTEWPLTSPFAPVATTTKLTYLTTWGVLAYELTDSFSVGGGIGINYADGELRRLVAPGTEFTFTGDDTAVNWILSAHWRPHAQHSFGVTYRGWTEFDLEGKARAGATSLGSARLEDFVTPDTLAAGYAYKPNPCWTIEANVEWVNWERLNTSTLRTAAAPPEAIPFEWDANFMYGIGASYEPDDRWVFSAGYIYIENSQPDATFNPAVSDADRHWLSAGAGYRGDTWDWQFAYQFAFSDRNVTGAAGPAAAVLNGGYDSRFHGFMLSASRTF